MLADRFISLHKVAFIGSKSSCSFLCVVHVSMENSPHGYTTVSKTHSISPKVSSCMGSQMPTSAPATQDRAGSAEWVQVCLALHWDNWATSKYSVKNHIITQLVPLLGSGCVSPKKCSSTSRVGMWHWRLLGKVGRLAEDLLESP